MDYFVTDITEFSKQRYKVMINQEFAFVLYKGELSDYGIKKGTCMTEEHYLEIMDSVLPKRAKLRAMNLLQSREYTRFQLEQKLKQGLYPEVVIEQALDYVQSYDYINDKRYAESYILYYSESRSRGRIRQDLLKKGLSMDLIKECFETVSATQGLGDEADLIKKLLEKKRYDKETATYEESQKMTGFLYRKGFSLDAINRALST